VSRIKSIHVADFPVAVGSASAGEDFLPAPYSRVEVSLILFLPGAEAARMQSDLER
jgi:hypothetical protein